jgi:hypothetical protein
MMRLLIMGAMEPAMRKMMPQPPKFVAPAPMPSVPGAPPAAPVPQPPQLPSTDLFLDVYSNIIVVLTIVAIVFSLFLLFSAWLLLNTRPAGRTVGVIACVLSLPIFPFGTGVGVYGLWVLLRDGAAEDYCQRPNCAGQSQYQATQYHPNPQSPQPPPPKKPLA